MQEMLGIPLNRYFLIGLLLFVIGLILSVLMIGIPVMMFGWFLMMFGFFLWLIDLIPGGRKLAQRVKNYLINYYGSYFHKR